MQNVPTPIMPSCTFSQPDPLHGGHVHSLEGPETLADAKWMLGDAGSEGTWRQLRLRDVILPTHQALTWVTSEVQPALLEGE